jgi:head-tail adaptor
MKPVFNIGRARHRILLQQLQTSSDSAGGTSGTWVDLLSGATEEDRKVFAVVDRMQGRRGLEYKQTVNYYPFSVVIRLNRSLSYTAKYRFLLDGKVYVIHSIINKNDRDFTYELLAYTLEQDGESALPTCADATAVLNNTLGTELSSTPIASGATGTIVAPDATIIINDNAGAEAVNTQVASGTTQIFNIIIT